ncbi:hypothetical protein GGR58DRAFT_506998 [Xylaria digitata]|nr:hypothetical protein GGR58DRAFT_506998 [Xylaria digitata]
MASGLSPDQIENIRNSPAAALPPGVIPDFDNPPNCNRFAVAVIVASLTITSSAVLIRFCSKAFCTRQAKLEDYLGLIAFPFFIAGTWVLITIPRESGFFIHQWYFLIKDLEGFLYNYVLSTTLYCVTLLLAKAAILLEWTHIFVVRSNRNKIYWICYGMIAVNTALYLATIIVTTFACSPRERIWRRYLPGTCIDLEVFNIFITSFHLLSDICMLLLPQIVIWKLKLAAKQKVGVSAVFSAGALACIWAAGRVASAVHLSDSKDTTYSYSLYTIWGLAEVATAQIIFCIPSFPVIFRQSRFTNFFKFSRPKTRREVSLQSLPFGGTFPHLQLGTNSHTTCNSQRTVSGDGGKAGITALEPVRVRGRSALDQLRSNLEINVGSILITTEIDITSHKRPDTLGKTGRKSPNSLWKK